jgi:hypothetical protein
MRDDDACRPIDYAIERRAALSEAGQLGLYSAERVQLGGLRSVILRYASFEQGRSSLFQASGC